MVDWYKALKDQGDLTQEVATKVTKALGDETLDVEQAGKLYRLVVDGSQTFDEFFAAMSGHDVDDALLDGADALEEMWDALVVGTANRVRLLRGLDPIESADDIED